MYLKNTKTLIQKDTRTAMFIAALFTIAKKDMKVKKVSINRWMAKEYVVYIHNGILLSQKKDILPFATTWMNLEGVMLSEISQRKTNPVCYHLYMESKN